MNVVIIQTTSLGSRTEKSLQNTDNSINKHFTQSDANVSNNSRKVVIFLNELRQSLYKNRHFTKSQYTTH